MTSALCLIDLDGTLREGRTVTHLAARFDVADAVEAALSADVGPHAGRAQSERVMACFAGVAADAFAAACAELPCRDGADRLVDGLHARGFRVGIVTASYEPAAVAAQAASGADLVAAITPEIAHGKLTGRLHPSAWEGACGRMVCKEHVLHEWQKAHRTGFTLAVGNADNDICMFQAADMSIAVHPTTDETARAADASVTGLIDILPLVDDRLSRGKVAMSADPPAEPPRH